MNARYRNISDAPPRYLLPPKPPRFGVRVVRQGGGWTARLTESWWQVLEADGPTPIAALYELERIIGTETVTIQTAEARQEAFVAVECAIAAVHYRQAQRMCQQQRRQAAGEALERAMGGAR